MNYNPSVTDYINEATKEQIEILETLRKLIHETVPGTTESIKWKMPVFGKDKDFTYFRFTKKHITLGFYNIDKIDDPNGLLEGSGNTLKHIKIKSKEDINSTILKKWLKSITS